MNVRNSYTFEMSSEDKGKIYEVVDDHIYMVWEKEGRPEIDDCDKWEDLVELAFNTSGEYQDALETEMENALTEFNPFSMVGLLNYINEYYMNSYGDDQAITEWKSIGAGNLYLHAGYAFVKNEYTREDMNRISDKYQGYDADDEETEIIN